MSLSPDDIKIEKTPDRPGLISFLSIINIFTGVGFIALDIIWGWRLGQIATQFGISPIAFILNLLFLGGLGISSGIGMWKGTTWGWWHGLYFFVYSVLRNLNAIFLIGTIENDMSSSAKGPEYYYLKHAVRVVISVAIVAYLFKDNVLNYFQLQTISKAEVAKRLALYIFGLFALMILSHYLHEWLA